MMFSTIADLALMALLVATLVFCIRLNKRLESIRGAKDELKALMASFDGATDRARAAVVELRKASDETAGALKERIDRGRALADELSIITDAGDRLASRLEQGLTSRRDGDARPNFGSGSGMKPADRRDAGAGSDHHRSEAEKDLIQTLRRVK